MCRCSGLVRRCAADRTRDGGPRIRPQDARITSVLQEGIARSATFRALVDRIEASNVIVYVGVDPLMKSSLAGALTWMTQAGDYRYLRASISTDLTSDQMIATLAHELQHAVEVIEDESVVDEKTLVALYKRIGQPSQRRGAIAVGDRSPRRTRARRCGASWSPCRRSIAGARSERQRQS